MGLYDFSNPNPDDLKEWLPLIEWLHAQVKKLQKN